VLTKTDLAVELCFRTIPDEGRDRHCRRRSFQCSSAEGGGADQARPQSSDGHAELASDIRRSIDARPTYSYRRLTALFNRERRTGGLQAVNRKRVYQLMKKHGLRLLARHAGRWRQREHAGKVATLRYLRWCSDGPEFTCWSGELVQVALVFDCHDREVIGWTTTGISRGMIRDRMIVCRSGGSMRRGRPMCPMADREWAHLCRCRHRSGATLASRRSEAWKASEWAEAFVKTFKRDYVRVNPIPGAASAPVTREEWMVDYNEVHPHGYRSPHSQCRTRCVSGLRRAPHDEIST
jgi:putative transposase